MTAQATVVDRRSHWSRERGSGTVLALGLVAALMVLTLSGVVLSGAVVASHRARAAGDLAALAGADLVLQQGSGRACAAAARVAEANGATLVGCTGAADASLQVVVTVRSGLRWLGPATATARAGPPTVAATGSVS